MLIFFLSLSILSLYLKFYNNFEMFSLQFVGINPTREILSGTTAVHVNWYHLHHVKGLEKNQTGVYFLLYDTWQGWSTFRFVCCVGSIWLVIM